jgi:hypothetical protein
MNRTKCWFWDHCQQPAAISGTLWKFWKWTGGGSLEENDSVLGGRFMDPERLWWQGRQDEGRLYWSKLTILIHFGSAGLEVRWELHTKWVHRQTWIVRSQNFQHGRQDALAVTIAMPDVSLHSTNFAETAAAACSNIKSFMRSDPIRLIWLSKRDFLDTCRYPHQIENSVHSMQIKSHLKIPASTYRSSWNCELLRRVDHISPSKKPEESLMAWSDAPSNKWLTIRTSMPSSFTDINIISEAHGFLTIFGRKDQWK